MILSQVALQDKTAPDCSHPPGPRTPSSAAQTLPSRLSLLLRSDCTATVAEAGLLSDFYSHGKQASFFSNLCNTFSSIPGCQQHFPPPAPGNSTAWEAAKNPDEGRVRKEQREVLRGVFLLGPHLS